ncbi:MAG: glycerol-3-phosphate dehydrogenase/oxidase [Planctomycetota bacterium]|nr:glycerol-3-phosphate dehydrogenase/oxidase [Planctomycetota bacterium]
MNRDQSLARLTSGAGSWDIAIIGGGATGVGIAVDAASRGYRACLLEQSDFGKGTSSRSTKLIHGGVRYLQRGNISLVTEALEERGLLRQNAPHLVHDLAFVVPNYSWWEAPFYGIGMKVYDLLAGKYGFGRSKILSKDEVLARIPTLEQQGLRGGVLYYDGQFDDTRLLINLAQTAEEQGATLVNYAKVTTLNHDDKGKIEGVTFIDVETGIAHTILARCIINATGPFADKIRQLDDANSAPIIAPSQGVHLVLDASFLPGNAAIMVPRTSDGRVLFAIPWHGHTLLGTTDTPISQATPEPVAMDHEIDFLLDTASRYLSRTATRADIRSVFAGVRPLVKASHAQNTAALSREHSILIADSGLITIAGGKWTTYRAMAEDCVTQAATVAKIDQVPCVTRTLKIHGNQEPHNPSNDLSLYGSDAQALREMMTQDAKLAKRLDDALPITAAQIIWGVREEMARTVEDILARRTRALFLNAKAAIRMAPKVASLLAVALGRDETWEQDQISQFIAVAKNYSVGAG